MRVKNVFRVYFVFQVSEKLSKDFAELRWLKVTTSSNLEIIITLNFEVISLKTAYLTLANSFFGTLL